MNWKYTIIDRNDISTEIDEMVGWDANSCEIKRDDAYHGIVFTSQGDNLQFTGLALDLIKTEYEAYGSEGILFLLLEEDCGLGYIEFSRGKFLFAKYEFICGEDCYVKIPVENFNEVMNLRNKINQGVNLDSLIAFDEVTALDPYDKLSFPLLLPSKAISVKDKSINENAIHEVFNGTLTTPFPFDLVFGYEPGNNNIEHYYLRPGACVYNTGYHHITFGFTTDQAAEIGVYGFGLSPRSVQISSSAGSAGPTPRFAGFSHAGSCPLPFPLNPLETGDGNILNFSPGSPAYDSLSRYGNLSYRFKGNITVKNTSVGNCSFFFMGLPDRPGDPQNGTFDADYVYLQEYNIHCRDGACPDGSWSATDDVLSFDINYSNAAFNLANGDRLFIFIALEERKTQAQVDAVLADPANVAWEMTTDIESFFTFTNLSKTISTTSKVFAINEAISRVTESITNGRLRLYSDYFGRTDSEPYTAAADGCGSLAVITDGLRIRRQENKIPDKPAVYSVSLQDIFDGLNPIFNIGFGLEPDPARLGYNRLRVEDWKFFYNDTLILSCPDVGKITHKCFEKEIFSTFSFGYAKWEAEEYTGLDEFLTKRSYRTTISSIKNDLVKLSKWIASGYALEITRRKGNIDSKDWRYDKDTFIICCKRDEGNIIVELGNIVSAENIIDPDTLYNYRISPVRNALRWMNNVLRSYRTFDNNAKIIFTDGAGNYFAKGIQAEGCRLESPPLAENETIEPGSFADDNDARPFLKPERITFDYPMTSANYKALEGNPYGKIFYSNECEEGYGFIDTISYRPEDQVASFTLIPAVDPTIAGCVEVAILGAASLPAALVGTPYFFTVALYGSQPFALSSIVKPAWLTIAVSGSIIFFTGTPDEGADTIETVSFDIQNCAGAASTSFDGTIAVTLPVCDPVGLDASALPDGYTSTPYNYSIPLSGDGPFVLGSVIKPAWMNVALVGSAIVLSGIPAADATALPVSFTVSNCVGVNIAAASETIDITTVCIPVGIVGSPVLPDGILGAPYSFTINLTGTLPFTVSAIVAPGWLTIAEAGSTIVFSGTPDAEDLGIPVSFTVENCTSDTVDFSDTIDVAAPTGDCTACGNVDGGYAAANYLLTQNINGGNSSG